MLFKKLAHKRALRKFNLIFDRYILHQPTLNAESAAYIERHILTQLSCLPKNTLASVMELWQNKRNQSKTINGIHKFDMVPFVMLDPEDVLTMGDSYWDPIRRYAGASIISPYFLDHKEELREKFFARPSASFVAIPAELYTNQGER